MQDMHNDIAVIQDDPLAHGVAIHRIRFDFVILFKLILNLPGNSFQMRLAGSCTNHEKFSERGYFTKIQNNDIFRFLAVGKFRAKPG